MTITEATQLTLDIAVSAGILAIFVGLFLAFFEKK